MDESLQVELEELQGVAKDLFIGKMNDTQLQQVIGTIIRRKLQLREWEQRILSEEMNKWVENANKTYGVLRYQCPGYVCDKCATGASPPDPCNECIVRWTTNLEAAKKWATSDQVSV